MISPCPGAGFPSDVEAGAERHSSRVQVAWLNQATARALLAGLTSGLRPCMQMRVPVPTRPVVARVSLSARLRGFVLPRRRSRRAPSRDAASSKVVREVTHPTPTHLRVWREPPPRSRHRSAFAFCLSLRPTVMKRLFVAEVPEALRASSSDVPLGRRFLTSMVSFARSTVLLARPVVLFALLMV